MGVTAQLQGVPFSGWVVALGLLRAPHQATSDDTSTGGHKEIASGAC